MLEARPLAIADVIEIVPSKFSDERGFFVETWSEGRFVEIGIRARWVQDNHSLSRARGVLRGLHFQRPPMAQAKLVRVSRGSIFDVAVDLRGTSPTYCQWVGKTLTAQQGNQLFVPPGFAHGFVTLEPDTEVQYKVDSPYSPECEGAIRFDDPAIGIAWPEAGALTITERDRKAPLLADCDTGF